MVRRLANIGLPPTAADALLSRRRLASIIALRGRKKIDMPLEPRGLIAKLAAIILPAIVLSASWQSSIVGQAEDSALPNQMFGRIVVTLGMSEADAIRRLKEDFDVRPARISSQPLAGAAGAFLINKKQTPGETVGTLTVKDGRIATITSKWTPSVDRTGALGEALFVLLARLPTGDPRNGWRAAGACSVSTADGVTIGTDTQLRLAEIVCGHQNVAITVSRTNGGLSQVSLGFTTQ